MSSFEPPEAAAAPPAAPPAEPPAEKGTKTTTYFVLVLVDGEANTWKEGSKVEASSSAAAVRQHIAGTKMEEGTLVAVPARSWSPTTFKTETQQKLAFS